MGYWSLFLHSAFFFLPFHHSTVQERGSVSRSTFHSERSNEVTGAGSNEKAAGHRPAPPPRAQFQRWNFRRECVMLKAIYTMSRLLSLLACIILSLVMLVCGLLVPAHLRAVDADVIARAGRNTPGLSERGLALVRDYNLGAAQLLHQAAQQEGIPDTYRLGQAINTLAKENPGLQIWGSPELSALAPSRTGAGRIENRPEPLTDLLIRLENRAQALEFLRASPRPAVRELLRFREVTNTVLFPPSQSASGQALDTALSICGLLLTQEHFSTGLSNAVLTLSAQANRGANSQSFEQLLMDLLSLGQRFNWGQMIEFIRDINDPETLRLSANLVRRSEGQLAVLFSAVHLSENPSAVAKYLMTFSQTGLQDLSGSLRFGSGGVNELLRRNQRLHTSRFAQNLRFVPAIGEARKVGLDYCLQMPRVALTVKWILFLLSGFLFAVAVHFGRRPASELERPLQVRGFHVAREVLFALGFLLVALLLSEPFLAQEGQKVDFPFRLRLPMAGGAGPVGTPGVQVSIMSQPNLLTLVLFFVLQGLLYTASVLKLAEIRRQRMPPQTKLKLLENEDHLFDAGLYLGFLGTIIAFIIFSLGVVKEFSLMVAYSSTSFGIIFVSIFKILHLRSARRKILLEAEAGSKEAAGTASPQALAVHL